MKYKKHLIQRCSLTLTAFLASITVSFAQISGAVKDTNGEPIIGASVIQKGTTKGVVTDVNGIFNFNVDPGTILKFSSIGYIDIEVAAQSNMTVVMEEGAQSIDDVVVVGYGGVQKAKTMSAGISNVKMDQLVKLPVTTIGEGLGGRVTGVITQQSSGAPGENTKIWIRGGANILYVIDDVVMETEQGTEFFNRLRPDDIASMSILKDASATAVYGPRAKDGVVVIATKRGKDGSPVITLSQKVSIMTPAYRPKVMSSYEYVKTRNDLAFAAFAGEPTYSNTELSKYYMGDLWQKGNSFEQIRDRVNTEYGIGYTLDDINKLFDPYQTVKGNIQDYYSTYDPWEMFDHVQPMSQTNVSIRGGGERIKYYSSLGYLNQNGISPTFDYQQVNFILNTDSYLLKDKSLKFTFNINGNMNNKKQPAAGTSIFNNAMYGHTMPTRPAAWSTGKARAGSVDALLGTGFNNTDAYRFQGSTALRWDLPWVKGLALTANVNFNTSYDMNKTFNYDQLNVYDNPAAKNANSYNPDNANLTQRWSNYYLLTGIYQIDYSRSFGKHNVAAMVNYQHQTRRTNFTQAKAKGYPTIFTPQIKYGAQILTGKETDGTIPTDGNASEWASSGFVGRVSYDYDGKYIIQYSANYNGSVNYSPKKRWGYFQAVSVAYAITQENWFKDLVSPKILNQFKLRAGYGSVGDELGNPFSYQNQYSQSESKVLFGDYSSNLAWRESLVANDLTWSNSNQFSGGLDIGLFQDRLTGSFDTYLYLNSGSETPMAPEAISTDILGMPNTPKINAPYETSRKGGVEFSLNWADRVGKFSYRAGVNYSYWDERVTRHADKQTLYFYNRYDQIGKRNMQSTYSTVYPSSGLFGSWDEMYNSVLHPSYNPSLGTIRLNNTAGDGRPLTNNSRIYNNLPGTVPLSLFGITLGANWNGFDIEVFFQGATHVTGTMPSPMRSQQAYMWNYGQYAFQYAYLPSNPNTNAILPIPNPGPDGGFGSQFIDRWVFDASYLKLKNISIRYDFKTVLLKNVNFINGLELSFVVTNAFTWTKKSYPLKNLQDPEFITSGAGIYNENGTLGSYPTQRSYTFGLTITL